jgi:KDO2-lipid IV(A) lauroyltransferase
VRGAGGITTAALTAPVAPGGRAVARGEPALVRGTLSQRARAAVVRALAALLALLPAPIADAVADAAGELWYRVEPARAARARGNLAHVVETLAARGAGSPRVRAAATDPEILEGLVRAVFRHATRTYVESLRGARAAREMAARVANETPAAVEAAFSTGRPAVFATLHLGSMAAAEAVIVELLGRPVTAPMETLADPELQRVIARARASAGVRIIGLREARRVLLGDLARGEAVGLIADRDITGGGLKVPLFGLPASLPIGPALLALEAGVPLHVAAVLRARAGTYRGYLLTVPHPPPDLPRRARVAALLAAQAAAFEELVAVAPEQWWTVFFPIWEDVGPRLRGPAARSASVRSQV